MFVMVWVFLWDEPSAATPVWYNLVFCSEMLPNIIGKLSSNIFISLWRMAEQFRTLLTEAADNIKNVPEIYKMIKI